MARKVYTYTEINKLDCCNFWPELKSIPQIVLSRDMRNALKNTDPDSKYEGLFDNEPSFHVASMRDLQECVLGDTWLSDLNRFYTYSAISKIIRDRINETKDILEKKWLLGCIKNVGGIYYSLIRLEESGVTPDLLDSMGDQNIELLKEIWHMLLEINASDGTYVDFKTFHHNLETMSDAEKIQEWLKDAFGITSREPIQKVVIHGFFYINTFQERIIDSIEKAGVELIYLIPYDGRYPFAYEIWTKTYGNNPKFDSIDKWIHDEPREIDPNGEIFEGRKPKEARNGKIRIREYKSLIEFSDGIKRSAEMGNGIYSAGCSEANEIVKSFYPDLYGERKLLAYPIGKFIWNINDMWDEEEDNICLSENRLLECFSSGWLTCDGYAGKDYMQDLTDIMPFFIDCKTISDWENRLVVLEEIEKNCISTMDAVTGRDSKGYRWHQMMGNPLSDFSQFSVPIDRVKAVVMLIRHLLSIARELFVDNKEISISDHIKRLNKILDRCEVSDEASELEREIAREILFKLNADKTSKIKCFPSDAAMAVELYLEGSFDDDELKGKKWAIMPMYHVDSAHVVIKKNWIHICMCDNDNMPGGKKTYPWPLNENVINNCYEDTGNENLKQWLYATDSTAIANRYFMYSALKHKNVLISWVSEVRGKKRAASPYVGLISSAADVAITLPKEDYINGELIRSSEYASPKITSHKSDNLTSAIPKEAKMDYAVCPLRYLYGYIVDDAPRFRNEFMQTHSISSLIVAISNVLTEQGISSRDIYKQVIELFPFVGKTAKQQIYDYIIGRDDYNDSNEGIVGNYTFGKYQYTEQRLRVHFPDYKARDNAKKSYADLDTNKGKKCIKLTRPGLSYTPENRVSNAHPCTFCPNVDYCKYSVFPKDREKIYGNE